MTVVERDIGSPAAQAVEERGEQLAYAIFVGAACIVGWFIRYVDIAGQSFPIGDGGLFYQMVRELQSQAMREPLHTAYNHAHIPFAYPPLGLYLTAIISNIGGYATLDVFRVYPFAVACLAVVAFGLLAQSVVPRWSAIAATFMFAVLPDSFDQEIKGGGVTRATGEMFAILAVWQLLVLFRRPSRQSFILSALFAALSVMSHPEWGPFVIFSGGLIVLAEARNTGALRQYAAAMALTAVLSAPWWLVVLLRYGPSTLASPIVGNAHVYPLGDALRTVVTLDLTHESWMPLGTVFVLIGLAACVRRRAFFLPMWLLMVMVTDSRGWQIPLAVPLCMLGGVGLWTAISSLAGSADGDANTRPALPRWSVGLVLGFLLLRAIGSAIVYESANNPVVSPGERTAMDWVSRETPASARFLVIGTGVGSSEEDVEWFPALTARQSVLTLQGTEWLPGVYARRSDEVQAVQACIPDLACVNRTLHADGVTFRYVYIARSAPGERCAAMCGELSGSPGYRQIYSGPGAWIFRRI